MSIGINPQINTNTSFRQQNRQVQQSPENNVGKKTSDKILKPAVLLSAITGVLIVVSSIAKRQGINFFKNNKPINFLKPSTWKLAKPEYEWYDIIKIGAGSVTGGLAAGLALDSENKKAKLREGFQQILGNIIIPVGCTTLGAHLSEKYLGKIKMPQFKAKTAKAEKLNQLIQKMPKFTATLGSLAIGIIAGNFIANQLSHKIFNVENKRHIQAGDFSGHVDDLCLAATLIAPDNKISKIAGKFIPAALLVAGFESGTKKA